MAELWVGAGQQYAKLAAAVAAAKSGDTIYLKAGVYENDFALVNKDLRIVGLDGGAHLKATAQIGNGKAILVTNGDVVLENLELSGARVADLNGAGVRFEGGSLTLRNCYVHHNENGLLAASAQDGRILVQNSEFAYNGRGDGQTHGLYVNGIASLKVENSHFHDTDGGHHVKSRALETEVRGSTIDDGAGDSAYSIDLPNGGAAVVTGNTIIQGAAAGNKYMLHYGGETANPHPGTMVVAENDFINHRAAGATAVLNQTDRAIDIRDNAFDGVKTIVEGPAKLSGNLLDVDLSPSAGGGQSPEAPPPAPEPEPQPAPPTGDGVVLEGGPGNDVLRGGDGGDAISGGDGADMIWGFGGDDRIDGGAGADLIYASSGNDLLVGGAGADSLFGGSGADEFRFAPGSGADMVGDFADGDALNLRAFELDGFAELKALCSETGAGLRIDLPGADSIMLSRRSLASLSADDVLL